MMLWQLSAHQDIHRRRCNRHRWLVGHSYREDRRRRFDWNPSLSVLFSHAELVNEHSYRIVVSVSFQESID